METVNKKNNIITSIIIVIILSFILLQVSMYIAAGVSRHRIENRIKPPPYPYEPPEIQWKLSLSNDVKVNSIIQNSDKSYILTGSRKIGQNYGLWIARISEDGKIVWGKSVNRPNNLQNECGMNIFTQKDDTCLIFSNFYDINENNGWWDRTPIGSRFVRIDKSGNISWIKHIQGMEKCLNSDTCNISAAQLSDGNLIIGKTIVDSTENKRIKKSVLLLKKVDINAETLWKNEVIQDFDTIAKVITSEDGSFSICLYIQDGFSLLRFDENGNLKWQRKLTKSDFKVKEIDDILNQNIDIIETADGNYGFIIKVVLRDNDKNLEHNFPYGDMFLLTNKSGNIIQYEIFRNYQSRPCFNRIVYMDKNEYILGSGTYTTRRGDVRSNNNSSWYNGRLTYFGSYLTERIYYKDIWLMSYNSDGTKYWDICIGSEYGDDLSSIIKTTDKGFLITGEFDDAKHKSISTIIKFKPDKKKKR